MIPDGTYRVANGLLHVKDQEGSLIRLVGKELLRVDFRCLPTKTWSGNPPKACEHCGAAIPELFVDSGQFGPWGILCDRCWNGRYGTGVAQVYVIVEGVGYKIAG